MIDEEFNVIEESHLETTLGNIHLYKKGNGQQSVLFLHGAGSDHALLSWREVLQHLPEHYTAYAIDMLGHGKSDELGQLEGKAYYEAHIKVVDEVVNQLKLNDFFLIGLSMGGSIATCYAIKYEEKVKALFLVNSWGFTKKLPLHRFSYWCLQHTSFTLKQFEWMAKYRALARWAIEYSLIGDKALVTEQLIDEVITSCRKANAGYAMQQFQRSSIGKDGCYPYLTTRIRKLQLPIIFISGSKDKLVPYRIIEDTVKQCINSSIYVLPKCKHWAVKEQPLQFVAILNQYR